MCDGQCRLEEVLTASARISLEPAYAIAAVGTRFDLPVEMAEVSIGGELIAEIDLVEAMVVTYLQYEVDIVGTDTDVLSVCCLDS